MIYHVLPVIISKFPMVYLEKHGVNIQQDGAKAHIPDNDPEWLEAVEQYGLKIMLNMQPTTLPDLNIHDLAFFRSIQSLYYHGSPKDDFDIIDAGSKVYEDYPVTKINRMWIILITSMNKIINHRGDNDYSIPHMAKESLERKGKLQNVIKVTEMATKYDLPTNRRTSPHKDQGLTPTMTQPSTDMSF